MTERRIIIRGLLNKDIVIPCLEENNPSLTFEFRETFTDEDGDIYDKLDGFFHLTYDELKYALTINVDINSMKHELANLKKTISLFEELNNKLAKVRDEHKDEIEKRRLE